MSGDLPYVGEHVPAVQCLQQAAQSIYTDATGANGDLSQGEIIEQASILLADFVHEGLGDYGITYSRPVDGEVLHTTIGRLVARAMLEQHAYTEDMNSESFIASLERAAGF
jgi:hypothetical protein